MSEIYKVCGIAIIAAVCAAVLKKLGSSMTPYITQVAALVIFIGGITSLLPIISFVREIVNDGSTEIEGLTTIFSATAIAVICGIVGDICKESGEIMLKNAVDFAANTEILLLTLPLITQVFASVTDILKL